ncbi:MAG: hypothetical protein IJR26_08570 [Bacteroidales bacterium]|nr:hypothetical protein [Bacteroidales bacterium]
MEHQGLDSWLTNRRSGFPARPKHRQPARTIPSSHWRSWEASPPTVGGRASQPDQ